MNSKITQWDENNENYILYDGTWQVYYTVNDNHFDYMYLAYDRDCNLIYDSCSDRYLKGAMIYQKLEQEYESYIKDIFTKDPINFNEYSDTNIENDAQQVSAQLVDDKKEGPNMLLIGGIAGGVALVAVVVVLVVVLSKKNKKPVTPAAPISMGGPIPPVPPAGQAPVPPSFSNTMSMMDTGAGETSVLGGGAGETSVLGGGAMQPMATLIRKKNGETANIIKSLFIIGKERQKVDFCVPDNNSVSRNHANIVCKGGVYYLVDKNSTNYTFVNGNKLNPNQEVKLNSGDKIKLADEEFEFRV